MNPLHGGIQKLNGRHFEAIIERNMKKYLSYCRYPNLDSYPIFYRGIPADLLDCFWAIDDEKSQFFGKAVWQVAYFSGHKLRDGYRKVTFLDRSQTDQIHIR
jgi:hypothetical protein